MQIELLTSPSMLRVFRQRISAWYARHARELPWRGTADPYRIWVSEVMLQQTTTQTVKGYFDRFIERFPDIGTLAKTPIDEVNRYWEGLGYYRRCAQMHRAANEIVERFDGRFPEAAADILSLPGIGRYTAGAILSIAFNQSYPILEANTIRLYARLIALKSDPTEKQSQKILWDFAEKILPRHQTGLFNQALMDLGSGICTPREPNCSHCPVFRFCQTAQFGLQKSIPFPKFKANKTDRTEVALLVRKQNKILVVRYPQGQRWAGLWDFPRCESEAEVPAEIGRDESLPKRFGEMTGRRLRIGSVIDKMKHSVTRYRITLIFCEGKDLGVLRKMSKQDSDMVCPHEVRWVSPEELSSLPMNSTARKLILKHLVKLDPS